MEKSEFQKLFREKARELGFQVTGNRASKALDDEYLVGLWLEHNSYTKAYCIGYGAIYLPDDKKMPFRGCCDWSNHFLFTTSISDDLDNYPIEDLHQRYGRVITTFFDYSTRTAQDFERCWEINIKRRLFAVYDKSRVLDYYRNNWALFRGVPLDTVKKISKLAELDYKEVIEFRNKRTMTLEELVRFATESAKK